MMYEQSQETAIAKACGWMSIQRCTRSLKAHPTGVCLMGTKDAPSINYPREYEFLPKYTTSLDAMHEAEKTLSGEQWDGYCNLLGGSLRDCAHATPAKKAEAFLRVKGLWKDNVQGA